MILFRMIFVWPNKMYLYYREDEEGSSAVSAHRLSLRLIKADPDDPVFMVGQWGVKKYF